MLFALLQLVSAVAGAGHHRGPWPLRPECPAQIRPSPAGQMLDYHQVVYQWLNLSSSQACAAGCCSDWSCWGFVHFARNGSCGLLRDRSPGLLPSPGPGVTSGVRGLLPARMPAGAEPSTAISGVQFGSQLYVGGAEVYAGSDPGWTLGDEFPTAWANDGFQYAGAGDNFGGRHQHDKGMSSPLTMWRIEGRDPPTAKFSRAGDEIPIKAANVLEACPIKGPNPGTVGLVPNLKSNSVLALGSTLYWAVACFDYVDPDLSQPPTASQAVYPGLDRYFNRQRYGVNDTSFIATSSDGGASWNASATQTNFFTGRLAAPRFIVAGQANKDSPDPAHVYALFPGTMTDRAFFENNDGLWLGRVPTGRLLDRSAWGFFAGMAAGEPVFTPDETMAVPVFEHPLMTAIQQVNYHPGLHKYLLANWGWVDPDGNPRGQLTSAGSPGPGSEGRPWGPNSTGLKDVHDRTQLTLWEADQPWGPWRYYHRDDDWQGPDGSSGGYTPVLPPAWLNGTRMWMSFTQCCPGAARPVNHYNYTYQSLDLQLTRN